MSINSTSIFNENLSIDTVQIGEEKQKILIIDDLLKKPSDLVEFAKHNSFEPYPIPKPGTGYPGLRLTPPSTYSHALMDLIGPIIIKEYDIPAGLPLRKAVCSMSLTTIKPEHLGKIQLTPHFDTSAYNQFAVLLYLCDESHGGTAFYRHNATNFEVVTTERSNDYIGVYFSELEKRELKPAYFTESDQYFTKISVVNAKYNRMVIYRSCLIHSPYITNPERSVDDNPDTGRLTVNSFVAF